MRQSLYMLDIEALEYGHSPHSTHGSDSAFRRTHARILPDTLLGGGCPTQLDTESMTVKGACINYFCWQ